MHHSNILDDLQPEQNAGINPATLLTLQKIQKLALIVLIVWAILFVFAFLNSVYYFFSAYFSQYKVIAVVLESYILYLFYQVYTALSLFNQNKTATYWVTLQTKLISFFQWAAIAAGARLVQILLEFFLKF